MGRVDYMFLAFSFTADIFAKPDKTDGTEPTNENTKDEKSPVKSFMQSGKFELY